MQVAALQVSSVMLYSAASQCHQQQHASLSKTLAMSKRLPLVLRRLSRLSSQCIMHCVSADQQHSWMNNIVSYRLGCRQVSHQVQSPHLHHLTCMQTCRRQNRGVQKVTVCNSIHVAQQVFIKIGDMLMSAAMIRPDARECDGQSSCAL